MATPRSNSGPSWESRYQATLSGAIPVAEVTERAMNREKLDIYEGWRACYNQDTAWSQDPDGYIEHCKPRILQELPNPLLLDLGCGDGRNSAPWLKEARCVIGLDITQEALGAMGRRLRSLPSPPPFVPLHSNIEQIPLADSCVDLVQCLDALPQVYSTRAALEEIARVLRPGGLVLFNAFLLEDCAYGEGAPFERNAFLYKGTLFRFFEPGEVHAMLPPQLRTVQSCQRTWVDPPHGDYRPYEHTHAAEYVVCKRE